MSAANVEDFGIVYARYGLCACTSEACVAFCIVYYLLVLITCFALFALCIPFAYRKFGEWLQRRRDGRRNADNDASRLPRHQSPILRVLRFEKPPARHQEPPAARRTSIELQDS